MKHVTGLTKNSRMSPKGTQKKILPRECFNGASLKGTKTTSKKDSKGGPVQKGKQQPVLEDLSYLYGPVKLYSRIYCKPPQMQPDEFSDMSDPFKESIVYRKALSNTRSATQRGPGALLAIEQLPKLQGWTPYLGHPHPNLAEMIAAADKAESTDRKTLMATLARFGHTATNEEWHLAQTHVWGTLIAREEWALLELSGRLVRLGTALGKDMHQNQHFWDTAFQTAPHMAACPITFDASTAERRQLINGMVQSVKSLVLRKMWVARSKVVLANCHAEAKRRRDSRMLVPSNEQVRGGTRMHEKLPKQETAGAVAKPNNEAGKTAAPFNVPLGSSN